jgi:hypothetical protein
VLKESVIKEARELVRIENSKIRVGRDNASMKMAESPDEYAVIQEKGVNKRREVNRTELIFVGKK